MADQGAQGLLSPFLRNRRCQAAKPFLHGEVLDLGCGAGVLANYISAENYLGVDTDTESLEIASAEHPEHSFQASLPMTDKKFDTVVALAVIEHVPSPKDFLITCSNYLKPSPNAKIVITTPHPSIEKIHYLGSFVGLFSRHANEEHEELLDYARLLSISQIDGLSLNHYERFLCGGNQLAVFSKI